MSRSLIHTVEQPFLGTHSTDFAWWHTALLFFSVQQTAGFSIEMAIGRFRLCRFYILGSG
ncbi:MAG: hypothetical protein CMJ81_18835 [Planctomycetaceae bacterium]|nr:hypothetical protein [Planctomycetaceae bacterium]MBP61405.1 hypothetical protein [Planctomycetaceae bacterium]